VLSSKKQKPKTRPAKAHSQPSSTTTTKNKKNSTPIKKKKRLTKAQKKKTSNLQKCSEISTKNASHRPVFRPFFAHFSPKFSPKSHRHPLGDLELERVLDDRDEALDLLRGELARALGNVHVRLLAHEGAEAPPNLGRVRRYIYIYTYI
jgi:hypothetical protein